MICTLLRPVDKYFDLPFPQVGPPIQTLHSVLKLDMLVYAVLLGYFAKVTQDPGSGGYSLVCNPWSVHHK